MNSNHSIENFDPIATMQDTDVIANLSNEELIQLIRPLLFDLANRNCLRIRVQHEDIISLAREVPRVLRTSSGFDVDISWDELDMLILDMEIPLFVEDIEPENVDM